MFSLNKYWAHQEPIRTQTYQSRHLAVLQEFDVAPLHSTIASWMTHPRVRVLEAYNTHNELVGGIRVQLSTHTAPLPFLEPIQHESPQLYSRLVQQTQHTAEICGAWVSSQARRQGVFPFLAAQALQEAKQLQVQTAFILVPQHTRQTFEQLGFACIPNHSGQVDYVYPDARYRSTLMQCDVTTFQTTFMYSTTSI